VVGLVHYAFAGMETDGVTVWPIAGGSGATVSILPSGVSPGAIFDKDGSTGTAGKYLSKSATGLYWDTPAGGSGGSGLTTVQTSDGTEAEAGVVGDAASGIFIIGAQGVETAASGNTVVVKADGVHTQVSAYALASASVTPLMTQATSPYAVATQVTAWETARGAALTTTGASLWAGATPYIVEASGIGSVTNWITSATSAFGTGSGTTTLGVTVYGSDGSAVSGASNVWLALVSGSSSTVVSDGKGGATLYYGVSGASSYFPTLNSSAFSATGGKLGIGTGSPSVRVHIYDNTVNPIIIQSTSGAGGDGGCYIKFQDGNGDVAYYGIEEASGGNAFFQHDAGKTLRIETLGGGLGSLTTGSLVDVASSTGSVGQFLGRSSSGLKWSGPSGLTVYGSGGSVVSGVSNLALVFDQSGTSTTVTSDGKGGATMYYGGSNLSFMSVDVSGASVFVKGIGSAAGNTPFAIGSSDGYNLFSIHGRGVLRIPEGANFIAAPNDTAQISNFSDNGLTFQTNNDATSRQFTLMRPDGAAFYMTIDLLDNICLSAANSTGNVGIGLSIPNANTKLDVQGIGSFSSGVSTPTLVSAPSGVSTYKLTAYGGVTVFGLAGLSVFQVDNTGAHASAPTLGTNLTNKTYVDSAISDVPGPAFAYTQSDNDVGGNTVYYVIPYNFTMSGVSLLVNSTGVLGVSVWTISGVTTAHPNVHVAAHSLVDISNGGAVVNSKSGTTLLTKGSPIMVWPRTIANGVSAYTLQFWGRKE
jgi:hypothetical protein